MQEKDMAKKLSTDIQKFLNTEGVKLKIEYDKNGEIKKIVAATQKDSIEETVTEILHQLGIPPKLKGYHYTRTAIIMVVEDMSLLNSITKYVYPNVAKRYEITENIVEGSIRRMIEKAWKNGNVDTLEKIFGYTYSSEKGRPTNGEFIALIADNIRMNMELF